MPTSAESVLPRPLSKWATLAAAAVLVLTLGASAPRPASPTVPAYPGLLGVHLGGEHLPVLVAPARAGANLVLVGGSIGPNETVRVGLDATSMPAARPRAGADGRWTVVDLPAGLSTLWFERGGQRGSVPISVEPGPADPGLGGAAGLLGPDGPECANAVLGGLLAGDRGLPSSCPAQTLTQADSASLLGLVAFLAGRGVRTLSIAEDDSPRSAAAATVVRTAAAGAGLGVGVAAPDSALVVVSGWTAATPTLVEVSDRQRASVIHSSGTYLAPWLLAAPVIHAATGAVLPLRFDPRDDAPLRYEIAVGTGFHGATPTAAGYLQWLAARGVPPPTRTRLYAASLVAFLPAELAAHHAHNEGWFPGGTVVPVTGPLI
jgi:hypothetical protein